MNAIATSIRHARTPPLVLAVGEDTEAVRSLAEQLRADGLLALAAASATHARVLARQQPPALVLLADLEEPNAALALLDEIRADGPPSHPWDASVPVIVVSRRAEEIDLLRAFEGGADDFLHDPFRYLELRARVRAQLRRAAPSARRRLRTGALEVDCQARVAALAGQRLVLSRLEFDLLTHLAAEPERVFTRDELLRAVWGFRSPGMTRTLDSHASRLRRKLDRDGGRWIANVRGVGYRLTD